MGNGMLECREVKKGPAHEASSLGSLLDCLQLWSIKNQQSKHTQVSQLTSSEISSLIWMDLSLCLIIGTCALFLKNVEIWNQRREAKVPYSIKMGERRERGGNRFLFTAAIHTKIQIIYPNPSSNPQSYAISSHHARHRTPSLKYPVRQYIHVLKVKENQLNYQTTTVIPQPDP